jgi:hypothetical protein
MVDAIYTLSQQAEPPLRTVLGADAFQILKGSYEKSLQSLEEQKAVSVSVVNIEGKPGLFLE